VRNRETLGETSKASPASQRKRAIMIITLELDGDKWCALLGENIQIGLAGFGVTPAEALVELSMEIELYGCGYYE